MASVLLSALHIEIFSTEDIVNGFVLLLESAQDTELDILDASNELAFFLARAVIDDVLAPLNLEEIGSRLPPNCSSTETVQMAQSLVSVHHAGEYARQYKSIIQEYFFSDDIPVLIQSLKDLAVPEHNPIFVKKLVILAMDGKNREKEMASLMDLSCFWNMPRIQNWASWMLQMSAPYLARAVVDDVLSPLKLEEIGSRLPPNCSATVTANGSVTVGTGWAVEDTKDKITKLLDWYESGGVVAEACQCIRDIGMPFFNHEVVKKALVLAMEKNGTMLDLLQECFSEGLINSQPDDKRL
ncbi:putative initiation factor eIF-4 gamma, MA3 [Rosa chinensis]|uniref:Putative initiation factor eIF-4 gamma, MA3 n=1 Tax=Rosa chinensis TaxID=74649 RepID=A0A2P6P5E3_ROSCH|nr:putative initiation factor eIF-4 gamma, MA3 [Rosa chinensis]